jgi:excisionase family DNA binding protein
MTQVPEHETASDPELLTSGQVAAALGVGVAVVQEWARNGKIPCITLPSGRRRIKREVVDAILSGERAAGAA